jgi:hypothetical protein
MRLSGTDLNPIDMRPISSIFAYRCLTRRDSDDEPLGAAPSEHLRRLARARLRQDG